MKDVIEDRYMAHNVAAKFRDFRRRVPQVEIPKQTDKYMHSHRHDVTMLFLQVNLCKNT